MKQTPLRYLARIQNSNVDKVIDPEETPVRLCNYVHVFRNDRITEDMPFDQGSATETERKVFALNPGDVIITKDSEDPREIGVPALVVSTAEDIVCGYHLTILRPNEGVHGPYLYYGLCSKVAQEQFMLSARGITRFGLNQTGIGDCAIPIPSMTRQVEIAEMLAHETQIIDDLIAEKGSFITLLREKRVAEISRAVTKGINPAAPMKPSGQDWLGDVPAHWDIFAAARLFDERDERSSTGDEELLTVSHLTGVTPRSEKTVNMIEAESTVGYKRCHSGDLVVNTLWAWMGAMGTAPMLGIVSPAYNIYTPRAGLMDARYIDHIARLPIFAKEVTRFSKGVWSSRLRLYPQGFREVRWPVPPTVEQAAIADYLDRETTRIDGLITETKHSIALLKEKRAALITAAVTGKIDVRNAA